MKHFKSIVTSLILAIAVVGVAPVAMALKEQIKSCTQCGQTKKQSQFPDGGNLCNSCVKKNSDKKKAEEKARKEAEKKRKELERQEKNVDKLIEYINSMDEWSLIETKNIHISDSHIMELINEYNGSVIQRQSIIENGGSNNPIVIDIGRHIESLRESLLKALYQYKSKLKSIM